MVDVRAGAEPYQHDGDDVGILLCHGFTGNPISLRPWAEHLAAAGHTVSLPRLPGHGTSWQEMNRTRWPQWYAEVERALLALRQRCRVVVVGGLSMGGALALRLAAEHGSAVQGLVLVNPAVKLEDPRLRLVPLLRWAMPSTSAIGDDIQKAGVTEGAYDRVPTQALYSSLRLYRQVTADLGRVDQPLLLFQSPRDHVVPRSSSDLILSRVASTDVTEVTCEESYHVATLDNDAPMIFEQSLAFVDRLAAAVGGRS